MRISLSSPGLLIVISLGLMRVPCLRGDDAPSGPGPTRQPDPAPAAEEAPPQEEAIDFDRARELLRKRERGELRDQVGLVRYCKPVARARIPFIAYTCVDKYILAPRAHEQAIETEPYAVTLIGLKMSLPDDARHDAEHRPAVERDRPVGDH